MKKGIENVKSSDKVNEGIFVKINTNLSKRNRRLLALIIVMALAVSGLATYLIAFATGSGDPSAGVIEKLVDNPTDYGASDSGEHMSEPGDTSELGRVKTDKTVRKVGFDSINRADGTAVNPTDIGDNFTVTFSALTSGGTIAGQTSVPADVVFILDISTSMNIANGSESRAAAMVDATNAAIADLLELNPNNRVAVVGFAQGATTIIPLQSPTKVKDGKYIDISNRAARATGLTIFASSDVDGGDTATFRGATNVQAGVYFGMKILADADPTVIIGGKTYNRAAGAIIMSDGGSNYIYNYNNWYDLSSGASTLNRNPTAYGWASAYYFVPTLEAAYMKEKVSLRYGKECNVTTVGFDLASMGSVERAYAQAVLDPSTYVKDGTGTDAGTLSVTGLRTDAYTYYKNAYQSIIIDKEAAKIPYYYNYRPENPTYLTLNYPDDDSAMPTSFKYNNNYEDVSDADDLAEAFRSAISDITDDPYAPTDIIDTREEDSGYIVFTDIVGDLMEVKEFKSILWANHHADGSVEENEYTFTQHGTKTTSADGNVDTYVFDVDVNSSWLFDYESTNLNKVIIKVDHSGANDVVTIEVPPALLPIVDYDVQKDRSGTVTSVTRNEETRPIKINYIVGPKEGVIDYIAGDSNALSGELKDQADAYIADSSHKVTTSTGNTGIALYTNSWEGSDEAIVPVAEFGINPLNDYYSFSKDTYLYTDSDCTVRATEFAEGKTYYYKHDVYIVNKTGEEADDERHVAISSLSAGDVDTTGNYVFVKSGVKKPLPETTGKEENVTSTKGYQLSSHWQNGDTVHQHQGNNGLILIEQPGKLQIDKTIVLDDALKGSGVAIDTDAMAAKEFEFKITLKESVDAGASELTGSYSYTISNPGSDDRTGTIRSGGTVKLQEDDTLLIEGLPAGAWYTIEEQNIPSGYSVKNSTTTYKDASGAEQSASGSGTSGKLSGLITSANTSTAEFTNEYKMTGDGTISLENRPHVMKVLSGRKFEISDDFQVVISPYTDNPASVTLSPTDGVLDVDLDGGNVIANEDADNGDHRIDNYFKGITFTAPGEYWFRISERDSAVTGITYSKSVYAYVVTVKDNGDGTMSIDEDNGIHMEKVIDMNGNSIAEDDPERMVDLTRVTVDGREISVYEATFTNTYSVSEISIGTPGLKTYEDSTGNKSLKADDFQFELRPSFYDADGDSLDPSAVSAVPMPEGAVDASEEIDGTTYNYKKIDTFNSASGDFGFGSLTYGQSDVGQTYRYVVQEIIPDDALANGTRTYVKRDDTSVTVKTTEDHGYLWHNPDDGNAVYDLKTIRYKGYTYDCSRHTVSVKVEESDGHITATVTYTTEESGAANEIIIHNVYDPDPAETGDEDSDDNVLKVTKELKGRALKSGEKFTFTLTPAGSNAINGIADGTIVLPDGGNQVSFDVDSLDSAGKADVFFSGIKFKKPGTYTFSISEQAGTESGMTYDSHSAIAVIKVIDDDGTLKFDGDPTYTGSTTFTNAYTTSDVDYGSAGALQIEKRVDGRNMIANKYEFKITGRDADSRAKIQGITSDSSNTITVTNASSSADGVEAGTQALTGLKFTLADAGKTFNFTVTESIPSGATDNGDGTYTYAGVTYAYDGNASQNFNIKVTDNGDGTLTAVAENETTGETATTLSSGNVKSLEIHFANKFEYTPVTIRNIQVVKRIEGRSWNEGDEFTFTLTASSGSPLPRKNDADNTEETVSYGAESGESANVIFGDLTFTKPGTYTYTFRENGTDGRPGSGGTEKGLTYDSRNRVIQIVVRDNGDGTLTATSNASQEDITFVNEYNAEVDYDPEDGDAKSVAEAKKTLNGREIRDREFLIDVRPVDVLDDEDEPLDGYATAAETLARFITTYNKLAAIDNDSGLAEIISAMKFTQNDTGKIFAFEVKEFVPDEAVNDSGTSYGDATDAEKSAGGFKLDGVTYNTNGIDHYRLDISVEDNGTGTLTVKTEWVGHDAEHHEIAGKGGSEESTQADLRTARLEFENSYEASTTATINSIKDLEGRDWTDSDRFSFKIERVKLEGGKLVDVETGDDEESNPLPNYDIYATNKTDAVGSDGTQHHAAKDPDAMNPENGWKIEITQDDLTKGSDGRMQGDFYYRITEIVPDDAEDNVKDGITYSATPRYARVHAEDTMTGSLTASVQYVNADDPTTPLGATPVFTNYYNPSGSIEIPVQKVVTGRTGDWTDDDEYAFTISRLNDSYPDIDGDKTVTIDKDTENHTAKFGKITFIKAGTYNYLITEKTDSKVDGIEFDSNTERRVRITVTDDGRGNLSIESIKFYTDSNYQTEQMGDQDKAVFTNKYKATSGEIDTNEDDSGAEGKGIFSTTKAITGRHFREGGAFSFTIEADKDGAPLPSESNKTITPPAGDDTYTFGFGTIEFTEEHLALSPITYTIKEVAGSTDGITYDTHSEQVIVTLEDDGKGKIKVTAENVDMASGEPSPGESRFTNVYQASNAEDPVEIHVIKDLQGRDGEWLASDRFTFAIASVDVNGSSWVDYTGTPDAAHPMPTNETTNNTAIADKNQTKLTEEQYFADPEWKLTLTQDNLTYDEDLKRMTGDFYYKLYEVVPDDADKIDGMTYDDTPQYVHVHAEDDRHGGITTHVYYNEQTPGDPSTAISATPVFTNEYKSPTQDLTVTKDWDDDNNRDGKRTDVVLHLFKQESDGSLVQVEVPKLTLAAGTNHDQHMEDTWEDLPIYKADGSTKITYVVQEEAIAGYSMSVSSGTITLNENSAGNVTVTNSYDSATTSVKVSKNWDDNNNQSGLRPSAVTVNLLADGDPAVDKNGDDVAPLTLSESNTWEGTFTDLPAMKDGTQIDYTVEEVALDSSLGYSDPVITGCQSKGYTITNTRPTTYTSATVTKIWDDDNNRDGIRPNYVEMQLYKHLEGQTLADREIVSGKTVKVTGNDNEDTWTATIDNLLMYELGRKVVYSFDEVTTPDGYTPSLLDNGLTVKNTHTDAKGTLVINKFWDDNGDDDTKRSDAMSVFLSGIKLFAGTEELDVTSLDPTVEQGDNNTTITFNNLDIYENGERILYKVTEDKDALLAKEYTGIVTEGSSYLTQGQVTRINLRNQHLKDMKSVHFTKIWNDGNDQDRQRPTVSEFIDNLELHREDETVVEWESDDRISISVDYESDPNAWTVTWSGLYEKIDGQEVWYHAIEKQKFEGYADPVYDNTDATHQRDDGPGVYDGGTITNTHNPSVVTVKGEKVWAGDTGYENMRPENITIQVLDGTTVVDTITVEEKNGEWKFESKELPKFRKGDEISYTVNEVPVTGYSRTVESTGTNTWKVTNTLETTSLSGIKIWTDQNNAKGLRPDEITLNAKNGNTTVKSIKVDGDATSQAWQYEFTGLPKYNKADGSTVDYTVEEDNVAEYEDRVLYKTTIINTLKTHDITGTKVWTDGGKTHDNTTEVKLEVYRSTDKTTWGDPIPESRYHIDWDGNKYTISGLADTDTEGNDFYYKVVEANADDMEDAGYVVTYDNSGATIPALTDGASSGGKIINTLDTDGQTATLPIKGEKKITGRNFRSGDSFTFNIEALNGGPLPKDASGTDVTSVTITPTSGDTAEIDFGTIKFDSTKVPAAGATFTYSISEVSGTQKGMSYDTTADPLTVKVEWVDGVLKITEVTPSDAPHASFTNTYSGTDTVTTELKATKTLDSRNFNSNDSFRFMITADDKTPMPANTVVTISNLDTSSRSNTFSFGNVSYTFDDLGGASEKVFTYTIVETAANQSGITYDENTQKLYVKLSQTAAGALTVEYSTDGSSYITDAANVVWPVFGNKYAAGGSFTPEVSKEVKGSTLKSGQFEFEITAVTSGAPMPSDTKAENKKDGSVKFGAISYSLSDAGKTYEYKITEVLPDGVSVASPTKDGVTYDTHEVTLAVEVTDNGDGTVKAEGSYTGETKFTNTVTKVSGETVEITVIKKWDDANNQDGIRPEKINIQLNDASDNKVAEAEVKEGTNWTYVFEDLPVYDADGKKIDYSKYKVTETAVKGYETKIDNGSDEEAFVITNTHTPETVGEDESGKKVVKATKEWDDNNDELGLRSKVTLRLIGKATINETEQVVYSQSKEIAKGASGSAHTVKWEDVPAKYDGVDIKYEVTEDAILGYETAVTGNVSSGFKVTNKLSDDTPATVKVTKEWDDAGNVDGYRPSSVKFVLKQKIGNAAATEYDTKTVSVGNNGNASYTWDKLPIEKDGKPILYSVEEKDVDSHYTAQVIATTPGEFKVVNTHTPDTYGDPDDDTDPASSSYKGIKITKVWSDNENKNKNRPDHVVFKILANGNDTGNTVVAFGDGSKRSWDTVGIAGLPKNDANGEIKYTVKEVIPGAASDIYTSAVVGTADSGFTVTNTYNDKGKVAEIVVVKEWQDEDGNVISEAPQKATVYLMKKVDGYGETEAYSKVFDKGASGDDLKQSWTDQPTYESGLPVTYSLKEDPVKGYDTSYEAGVWENDNTKLTLKVINKKIEEVDPETRVTLTFVDYLNPQGDQIIKIDDMTLDEAKDLDNIKPEDPNHAGYAFQQWDYNLVEDDDGNWVVAYVAQYQNKVVTVSYVNGQAQDGKYLIKSEQTTDVESVVDPAEDPYHEGCTFKGWVETTDAGGNIIRMANFEPKAAPPSDPSHCYVDPPVRKAIKGNPRTTPEFTFTFSAVTSGAPMPDGVTGTSKAETIKGGGAIEFGWIEFNSEGTYRYSIKETDGGADDWNYEKAEYEMEVVVTKDSNGNLQAERTYYKDGKKVTDMTTAVFTNTYTGSDTDDADYNDGDDNNGGTESSGNIIKRIVDTSDPTSILIWIMLILAATLGILLYAISRRDAYQTRR